MGLPPGEPSDGFDEGIAEAQTIQIGTFRSDPVWSHLSDYVSTAKQRLERRPIEQFPVLIDFGPLSYSETQASWDLGNATLGLKEKAVRTALGLNASEDLWSELFSILVIYMF